MDEGAAFGFFPQLRPRRRLQDPIASADVPLQVLRGRLAGLLGAPADIGNIVRSPMPMEAFGSYDYEQPQQLPYTTEQFLKELPLAPTAPVGQLAGQAASFVPLNPAPLVRGVQKVGTMVGEGMAERVATGRPMLPSLLAEPPSAMFAVEPNVPRMNLLDTPPETMTSLLEVKPQAVVSDLGFYSAAEQAALNLQRNKGSGQAFLNDLLKAENVKKDELQWMGVDDFLKEKPNVTKQEVQDFIANNRVDVQERQLAGQGEKSAVFSEFNPDTNKYYVYSNDLRLQGLYDTADEADAFVKQFNSSIPYGPSKYDKYQLPGGENYREILLTLPEAMPNTSIEIQRFTKRMEAMRELQNEFANAGDMEKAISFAQKADDLQAHIRQLEKIPVTKQTENYQSSHFDEPNILAHIRVNDRVDADGKKMLLIEEIQSDWHQAGREKGYNTPEKRAAEQKKLDDLVMERQQLLERQKQLEELASPYTSQGKDAPTNILDEWNSVSNRLNRLQTEQNRLGRTFGDTGVPDAPFKDTWYQLALKRALKYAADNGYERVGLTTGKQQADRYKMSNEVNSLAWRDAGGGVKRSISLELVNGDNMTLSVNNEGKVMGGNFEDKSLSSVLGKDLAKKIMAEDNGNLMGNGLNIGNEKMKKYYDEVYPQYLDKYGKKWNAKVGETQITTDYARDANGIPAQRPSKESIRYIDITPEMKGAVSKGQPLFAATPAIPLGAQGLLGEPEKKKELSLLD